jgi:hypothetical protein
MTLRRACGFCALARKDRVAAITATLRSLRVQPERTPQELNLEGFCLSRKSIAVQCFVVRFAELLSVT